MMIGVKCLPQWWGVLRIMRRSVLAPKALVFVSPLGALRMQCIVGNLTNKLISAALSVETSRRSFRCSSGCLWSGRWLRTGCAEDLVPRPGRGS